MAAAPAGLMGMRLWVEFVGGIKDCGGVVGRL